MSITLWIIIAIAALLVVVALFFAIVNHRSAEPLSNASAPASSSPMHIQAFGA